MVKELKFKKGDEVAVVIEPMSNASRGIALTLENIENWVFKGTVIAAGRKYIKVAFRDEIESFEVENSYKQKSSRGGEDYRLYESYEGVVESVQALSLYREIQDHFQDRVINVDLVPISLEKLEQIRDILNK